MNKNIYSKLARDNIKKNKSTYLPFILSSAIMIALYYILYAIAKEVGFTEFYGRRSMRSLLSFGVNVIAIFSALFIFYTNSFLLKRRQKELGLYSVLGMEKKHISRVLSLESLYSAAIALALGISFGILFSKLMFGLLLNIVDLDTSLKLAISIRPIFVTLVLFILIFGFIIIFNIIKINKTSPIELIRGAKKGEREPKGNWLIGLMGLISLGWGYYLALTIKNLMQAFFSFFIAVILVMVGTYFLFTSGSIIIIKLLRKNKKFYYKKDNFISVSNMIYRMKQNALGLANIAILSTAVILILSTTVSLYIGLEDILKRSFPEAVVTNYIYEEQDVKEIEDVVLEHGNKNNVEIKNPLKFYDLSTFVRLEGNALIVDNAEDESLLNKFYSLTIVSLEDYNQTYGESLQLESGEIFLDSGKVDFDYKNIKILNKEYKVKDELDLEKFKFSFGFEQINIVVGDMAEMKTLERLLNETQDESGPHYAYDIKYNYNFNIEGKLENKISFGSSLRDALNGSIQRVATVQDKYTTRSDTLSIYGSLFFIGIFLGTIFMIATVLIIYYKQITEGYEDSHRFKILQEVGMSKDEVKKTIRSQILLVFFLPLVTAIIHTIFAFPLVNKILLVLNLDNTRLFLSLTGIVIFIFALAYGLVYRWTARVYYKIVN